MSLTPASPQAIDQGVGLSVAIKATLTNDTSGKGVFWGNSGLGSLTTTSSSAIYHPPTNSLASAQQVTVTATSFADQTKSASVQFTVNPYPAIPFQTLGGGTVGVPYSQSIALTGGTAPFQWNVYNGAISTGSGVGGSVPDGLMLNATTGVISGTPTAAGTWYFQGIMTDADGATVYNGFLSIQISPSSAAKANPVPFLNAPLAPTAILPGSGGFTLRVSGTGFASGATVDFNGAPLTTTFVDSSHLSALVPATDVATTGTASITVVNPAPGGGSSNAVYFQVATPELTVNFVNAPNSPLQAYLPFGLATADFNQDGKADLVIAGSVRVYMMLSNGDGTFTPAPGSPLYMPSPPYDSFGSPYAGPVVVGDFNHSGHVGLAVAESFNEAAVILLGNGNGTFALSSAAFAKSPGMPVSAIGAADFNADGNLDLALVNSLNGFSQVDLGYGKGAFNAAGQIPSGSATATGDFNSDGKLDLVVVVGDAVFVSLGNGDGTFSQATELQVGYGFSSVVVGDMNGDGKLDVAAADESGNAVRILLGSGDGTFKPPITVATAGEPTAIVVGDFNNDGKLDLATANGDGTVTLLLGNGDGTFKQASGSPYTVGKSPDAIAVADFNGDGKLDLAVANALDGTGSVSILLQQ